MLPIICQSENDVDVITTHYLYYLKKKKNYNKELVFQLLVRLFIYYTCMN